MQKTEVLTRADFWTPLKEKYPDAMKHYCDWTDQLKRDVYWDTIFCFNSFPAKKLRYEGHTEHRSPKAHELLAFLQIGIFMQYVVDEGDSFTFDVDVDWKKQIGNYFRIKQKKYQVTWLSKIRKLFTKTYYI